MTTTGSGGEGANGTGKEARAALAALTPAATRAEKAVSPREGPIVRGRLLGGVPCGRQACCRDFGATSKNEGIDNQWLPMTNVQTLVEYGQLVVVARGVMAEGSAAQSPSPSRSTRASFTEKRTTTGRR